MTQPNNFNKKFQTNTRLFGKTKEIHFLGIGGIGMSGIARILLNMGFNIRGSDLKESQITRNLRKEGCKIFIGHKRENIQNSDVVVTSSAVSPANEEILQAKESGIPIIHRGEMLAELMRLKFGIAVAGTHGKTTTTSLAASVCIEGELEPTYVIGGNFLKINSNSSLGKSDILICEADESDGSFLKLNPSISIVTNIDLDHMEYYKSEENLILHFINFINKTPFYGKNILCFEDEKIKKLVDKIEKPYISYGFSPEYDVSADSIRLEEGAMQYNVNYKGESLGDFRLKVFGKHNVLNSLAAIAAGLELDIPVENIKSSLSSFDGVARRMYPIGETNGYQIIDDYGHHPTEIKATLEALKLLNEEIIVIFQPHRYSRTLNLYREFAKSLKGLSLLFLMDIYSAGETPVNGVSSELILNEMKKIDDKTEKIFYIKDREKLKKEITKHLKKRNRKGILLTLGAGDVYKIGQEIADEKRV